MNRSPSSTAVSAGASMPILVWATLGAAAAAFSLSVALRWISSAAFLPVPLTAADAIPQGSLLLLRLIEAASSAVALWALLHYLVLPWRRLGSPSIEGLLLIGALLSYVLDTTINYRDYLMAWNKHALNFGTWAAFFPGHTGPTRYAEALLWGPPMYLYLGVLFGAMQLSMLRRLQRHGLGFVAALAASFAVSFWLDFVAESGIIHAGAYAWPHTVGILTVWAGSAAQFPLYESLLVGVYASSYALLLRSRQAGDVSFIERGAERLPGALRGPARLLAATGFATLTTFVYFAGFNLISLGADTRVSLPSWMLYADPNWTPPASPMATSPGNISTGPQDHRRALEALSASANLP